MNSTKTKQNIPKGWRRVELNSLVGTYVGGGTPSRMIPEYWGGDVPWLTVKDFPESLYVDGASESITKEGLENSASHIVPTGAVITAIRVGLGHTFVTRKDMAINQDLRGIIPNEDVSAEYLARYLTLLAPKIISDGTGSTVKGITLSTLKSYEILVPPLPEQKKIAEILGAVDEEIQKTDEIISATEKLKRGLMQQIFSEERGWETVKLGDVAEITNGKTNTQDAVEEGRYPLFDRSVAIKRSNKYLFDGTAIILPGEGAEFIPRHYSGKFDLHQRTYAIFPGEGVDSWFLFQYLYAYRAAFAKNAVGSTVKSLRLPIIKAVNVPFPPASEQQRIAEILSSVDKKIAINQKLKEKLTLLKKGLMQDLLSGNKRTI